MNLTLRSNGPFSTRKALTAYFIYRVREIVYAWPHRSTQIDVTSVCADLSEHEKDIVKYLWTSCEQFIRSHTAQFKFDSTKLTVNVIETDDDASNDSAAERMRTFEEVLPLQSFIPIQCLSVHLDEISQKKIQAYLVENPKFTETYVFQRVPCYYMPNSTRKCESNTSEGRSGTHRMRSTKVTEQIFVVNRKWKEECGTNFSTYTAMIASFLCNSIKEEFLRYGLPSYWILLSETLKTAHCTIQKIVTFVGIKRFALLFDRDSEAQVALLGSHNRPWVRNISGLQEKVIHHDEQTKSLLGDASNPTELLSEADYRYRREYGLNPVELALLAFSLPCQRSISIVRATNFPSVKEMYRRLKIPENMVTLMFPTIFHGEQRDPSLSSSLSLRSTLSSSVRKRFSVRLTNFSAEEEERIRKLLYAEEFTTERNRLFECFRNPDEMNGLGIKPLPHKSNLIHPMSTKLVLHYTQKHVAEFENIAYRDLLTRIMADLSADNREAFKKGIRRTHHSLLALIKDYPKLLHVEESSEMVNQKTIYYHLISRGCGGKMGKTGGSPLTDEENPYHETPKLLKLLVQMRGERSGEISQGNFMGFLPLSAKQVIRQAGGLDIIMNQFSKYFSYIEQETYGGKKMRFYSLTPYGHEFYTQICRLIGSA